MNGLFGKTQGGLDFQRAVFGFQAAFHVHNRVRFGLSFLNGIFVYQRAYPSLQRDVYSGALSCLADLDVALLRGREANALVLTTTLGYEWIYAEPNARDGDASSAQAGLAWRY